MKFKDMLAKKTNLPADILPASYQVLGNILLLKLLDRKALANKKKIGAAILKIFPHIKTVCLQSGVSGEFRKPKIEIIAGSKNTKTIHHELGCVFKLDVSKIMWSKGNHYERQRMISTAKKNEVIADMFAGIGYWTIPIAKHKKAKHIFAVEKNKTSFDYLKENIRLNYIPNITPILGDCRKVKLPAADRIIMGYFPDTIKFLPAALKISRKGTIIHLHELGKDVDELKKRIENLMKKAKVKAKILNIRVVKEYSPSKRHYVFDILCI